MSDGLVYSDIPSFELFRRGKVRDIYAVNDKLLIVATDRISAFDVVLPDPIPYKGLVLTSLSLFWFDFLKHAVKNHLVTADADSYPPELAAHRNHLAGRSMLVLRADVVPFECVARGYLSGSGWKDYRRTGEVCGIKLPPGLKESDKLPQPIFTPATKAESGHDINVSIEEMAGELGNEQATKLRDLTLKIYEEASQYADQRGIIIADTKFEFGIYNGEIILVDEVLTPDSSRFWLKADYQPGQPQQSFDKQHVRDYLETLEWDKRPPGPHLPEAVIAATTEKYLEAHRLLTGEAVGPREMKTAR